MSKNTDAEIKMLNEKLELYKNENQSLRTDLLRSKAEAIELRKLAMRDPLTGLYSRHFLDAEIKRISETKSRELNEKKKDLQKEYVCMAFIDMDGLKNVNDTYGHEAGDVALIHLARTLENTIRKSDLLARISGDEFIIVTITTDRHNTKRFTKRLMAELENLKIEHKEEGISFSASAGFHCKLLTPDFDFKKIKNEADRKMYQNKKERQKDRS